MRGKAHYEGPKDSNGVMLREYGKDYVHSPIDIANFALGNYQSYIESNDSKFRRIFFDQAAWFLDQQVITKKGFGVWRADFGKPVYGLKPGWVSAMAQGMAMSVLLRAWRVDDDRKWFECAESALGSFSHGVGEGGVVAMLDDNVFFEEYPSNPPSFVLNGFIRSMTGLYDMYIIGGNSKSGDLFNSAVETLAKKLDLFDCGYWTKYDLFPAHATNLASPYYHRSHIHQMNILYQLTGKNIFRETAERWKNYERNPFNYSKALIKKIFWKILKKGRMAR